jgi:hypothetical protein
MSDTTAAGLSAEISAAVEDALAKEQIQAATVTAAQAEAEARSIYTGWRNAALQNLSPSDFEKIEAASGALVAAIAAKLTSHA